MLSDNTFNSFAQLEVDGESYGIFRLNCDDLAVQADVSRLPFSIKVLLENLLRNENPVNCTRDDILALVRSADERKAQEIAYHPARVLMQDFTGVPAVVDLAAMRAALRQRGVAPNKINPLSPVDLVIDHSVTIDRFGNASAFEDNVELEMQRNRERYEFLKWGQNAFNNFSVVPPGTGICHQVNLEYLAKAVWSHRDDKGQAYAYPDTLVGTDSHTTMINGLGVLGWGVGGIEAEAAMLGQPVSMLIPEVVGFELTGKLNEGITATDLVLRVVQMLREHGVVGKFVEFYGEGLNVLTLADRATIANMAPEYGATCGFFPIDQQTLEYLKLSGRDDHTLALVEAYCREQGLWREPGMKAPSFASTLHLDMSEVVPNLAGPKRPQDRVAMSDLKGAINEVIDLDGKTDQVDKAFELEGCDEPMHHGDVVIASITSCTNTSNPAVMLGAGLVAKKALEKGLQRKPWVKSSLAPGSKVVTDYLKAAGLDTALDSLGFNLVGYGCTTCIGNSGPLPDNVTKTVSDNDMLVSSVLSGNRNFEGRIHPLVEANWLASPPLVVAYALAGTTRIDLSSEPLGKDQDGNPVYLADIWPTTEEIAGLTSQVNGEMFQKQYASVFDGDQRWQNIPASADETYDFRADSTYIQLPPFFEPQYTEGKESDIKDARILAKFGDSVTTDHISPAGAIPKDSPAAKYLRENGVDEADFNSFGSRRGNHEVMMRGTFGNIRIRNELVPGTEGGYTRLPGSDEPVFIYDAAMQYMADKVPTVVIAGKEYGTGSSRDWAAKGTLLLGVKAVIAESFERIHRSNLVGMGVLPLQFADGVTRETLELNGDEEVDIIGVADALKPQSQVTAVFRRQDGTQNKVLLDCRLDTEMEVQYYRAGGILTYVLNRLATQ